MSSQDMQVIIRSTSNEDVREYHLGQEITEKAYSEFFQPMYGSESDFDLLGPKAKQIADKLMGKDNASTVSRVTFRPKSVRVYKSPTVDWATVESTIVIPALKAALGQNIEPVQYGTTKYRELAFA